jgi:hypothetical protein
MDLSHYSPSSSSSFFKTFQLNSTPLILSFFSIVNLFRDFVSLPGYRANRFSNESLLGLLLLLDQFGHVIFLSPNVEQQQQQSGGIQLPVARPSLVCQSKSKVFPSFFS